ncbi:MAG: hypothetical protein AB7D92_00470 [Sphaerochaeta sp.]
MNRRIILLVVLAPILVFIGCEDTSLPNVLSLSSLEGTWAFPDQGGYTDITVFVMPDDATSAAADIGWTDGTCSYWTWGSGSYSNGVITGTYDFNCDDSSEDNLDTSGLELSIQITFTLDENNRLSFTCSGSGPLNGKSFANGVLQVSP